MPILFLIVFIDLVGFGIIIPLLPFYGEFFGASPWTIGLLMAVYSLFQFLAAPFWGRLSDRVGRKPVLVYTLLGGVIAYLIMGFADELWMLFVARALAGIMAGNISAAFAYAADVTTRETRSRAMGMIGAAFGLGFIFGPAIGGLLAGSDPATANYAAPAFAAAAFSAIALILAVIRLKESLKPELRAEVAALSSQERRTRFRTALSHPAVMILIALNFLAVYVFAGLETTFSLWSNRSFGWGPLENGYLFAYVGLLSAFVQGGLVGRLAKRFGEVNLLRSGAGLLALGIGLIPWADSLWTLGAVMALVAFGFGLMTPVVNSLISLNVSETEQGGVMGVSRSASTLARVLGPIWAGYLFGQFGPDWPYHTGAVLMIVVLLIALVRVTAPDPSAAVAEKT
ncbi:MAG: MFS transporter [Magnetovibrionaceae bacterium]